LLLDFQRQLNFSMKLSLKFYFFYLLFMSERIVIYLFHYVYFLLIALIPSALISCPKLIFITFMSWDIILISFHDFTLYITFPVKILTETTYFKTCGKKSLVKMYTFYRVIKWEFNSSACYNTDKKTFFK
jgi:hypothetical protein